jgi:phosphatidylserine/phosphatidylglycerophosphate/cardiolipin synthase-like enzyme
MTTKKATIANRGLVDVALADLELLAAALESARASDLGRAALQPLGLGHLAGHLAPLEGLDAAHALPALQAVIAERRLRPVPHLELVWTGPEAGLRPARDTAVVVRELFARAERRVLVGGFRFDHGEEILRPLHQAMATKNVTATFFLDVESASKGTDPEQHATKAIARFFKDNWSFGPPRPEVCYDPRIVEPGSLASLHAKCVVVDDRWAFVSSANFTDRGLRRNLEAGVLIEDETFAARLAEQWLSLIASGQMRRG